MPVRGVAVCVPAKSVTETVAVWAPIGWVVSGLNITVKTHAPPGAKVVWLSSWPPPAGPQVDNSRTMVNSVALVPPSAACVMPVRGTLPVLVSVNTWTGPSTTPRAAFPKACDVGVSVAAGAPATPVPVRATGEPVTATLAAMIAVPAGVTAPSAVGENATLIVQVLFGGKALPHVPPAVPAGRA